MSLTRTLNKLDRRAFEAVAEAHLPGFESVLPTLSRAADNSLLWFGTAAAFGLSRKPHLRRAALRGVIGISVASPIANLAGKHAFRRKRPILDLVPQGRRRWAVPTSHAFPSGHAAAATAFATAVAMEARPRISLPIAGLAAAVALSRVYTGAHYPGDVLAGIGIGAGAGIATRLVWPARPSVSHVVRTGGVECDSPTITEDGQGIVAVVNPDAGPGPSIADTIGKQLPAAEIVELGPDDDVASILDKAAGRAEVLAVAGGDGTMNAGAQAALKHDVTLLPIPGGTLNRFARTLGIETVPDAIAAYRSGCVTRVDVGRVEQPDGEDLVFLNTASFGAYTELVDRRERLEDRLGKWPALAVAATRVLRNWEPDEVVIDGRIRHVWLAFIGNCEYGTRGTTPTWRRRLSDGRLDIRLITTSGPSGRLRALAAVLVGHLRLTPGYSAWHAGAMRLSAPEGRLRLARDGETCEVQPSVVFGKHPAALQVFCPV
ncbi:bifunctional phosphatase PAP2/diacylglycerol kinase family protein [Actinomadura sp. HBU206391]|uniref:bifunctional phosphatase PAP2/diacylglycerol kinase family protein n=1 Tax=Actinomadura sp. HBU206391 TaxID=2731692 RepID=UPI00164FD667|nr:bifunctional phosphatase PAP2/diacylglycerol kinase family protein [Actinomadura sp. HBU206391]MBC6460534.1 phosphatase PAP2 family protein [Actinomadura sp. HBU206391]